MRRPRPQPYGFLAWISKEITVDDLTHHPARGRGVPLLAACLALAIAACTPSGSPAGSSPADGGGGAPSAAGSAAPDGGQPGSGEDGVEGSLTTSGVYDATWTWELGNSMEIGDIGGITLNSDQATFGNITVKADGSIEFGSTAPELPVSTYTGTGAQVTLDTVNIGYVCSFTLDDDLTGSDGSVLHIAGTMTFHLSDEITPC
jgi:hypothetical protein